MHKYSSANYKEHTNTTYSFMDMCMHVCLRIKSWIGSLYLELVIVVTSDRMGREIRLGDDWSGEEKPIRLNVYSC